MSFHFRSLLTALLVTIAVWPGASPAQHVWPSRPIRIVSPGTPGQAADVLARTLAQHLSLALSQAVFVDNKAGAGGMLGTTEVAKAPPDGYTLLVASSGPMAISPAIYDKVPYDPVKDFQYIANLAITPQVLLVASNSPYRTVNDLVQVMKARPGELTFGSTGPTSQLAIEALTMRSGMKPIQVPFKGNAEASTQLIGGHITAIYDTVPGALGLINAGKVRPLAVASAIRSNYLPETPTLREAGFPGADAVGWIGIAAPAGTPLAIVERMNGEIAKAMQKPQMVKQMELLGFTRASEATVEFAALVAREKSRWAEVAKHSSVNGSAPR